MTIVGSVPELQPLQPKQSTEHASQPQNVLVKVVLLTEIAQLALECVVPSLNLTVVQLFPTIVLISKTLATPQPIPLVVPANTQSLP